jgi:hypothetical protein
VIIWADFPNLTYKFFSQTSKKNCCLKIVANSPNKKPLFILTISKNQTNCLLTNKHGSFQQKKLKYTIFISTSAKNLKPTHANASQSSNLVLIAKMVCLISLIFKGGGVITMRYSSSKFLRNLIIFHSCHKFMNTI